MKWLMGGAVGWFRKQKDGRSIDQIKLVVLSRETVMSLDMISL